MGIIIMGTLYLIIGQVVRVYPNILAGYSRLSSSERENAEKNGLPFYASLLFSLMGGVVLIGFPVSIWLENPKLSVGIFVLVTIVGLIVSVVGSNLLVNNRFR
ncbi:DUF3784 domain-containing protein [Algoriphagus sp. AGSA1]|uniref:DUF3784 domain-containing protein n=1 Tax=Algoriphagus sp. AGSA1 TaxID=2907213 RepID=UPI001F4021D9|nr:DUF3784 domain-containing protein [Algoriphagus sp. AGSA1]MCE7057539.1 DUF3784 domain-containing protein [Algoriphagus sp. AGSA1]